MEIIVGSLTRKKKKIIVGSQKEITALSYNNPYLDKIYMVKFSY